MRTYLIKRVLLMIPTLFGISLVVFVIINCAPGSPAATRVAAGDSGGAISAKQVASKETYQIFKKQFHLDKDILLNRFPWLGKEKLDRRIGKWIGGSTKEQIYANDVLCDYGRYAIPPAVALLEAERAKGTESSSLQSKRRYIVALLSQNALVDIPKVERPDQGDFTDGQKRQLAWNGELQVENNLFRGRIAPFPCTPAQAERIEELWIGWFRGLKTLWGSQKAEPADTFDIPFREAGAKGTAALREAGASLGTRLGASGAESLVAWMQRAADLPAATEFGAAALDAMRPLPPDALPEEKLDRANWLQCLTAGKAPSADAVEAEVRREAILGRWRKMWAGCEGDFRMSFGGKLRTALFDTRFANYWKNLIVFDFGESLQYKGRSVNGIIQERLKVSITFALLSFLISYLISIPIGVFSAVWKDSLVDRTVTVILFVDYSLPSFFTALLLLQFFTIGKPLQWFPTSNFQGPEAHTLPVLAYLRDVAWHLVLPVICLSMGSFAALSRYMRAGLLEIIQSDYIRTARAKGLSEWVVILKHGLRNGMIPILTMVGGILPALIGGSVIIEYIFNINGMGLLMIESIFRRDYNVVMADAMIAGLLVLCGILVTDILYVLVDPRITFD
jgi:ABC-type dipeptide/oligopeptide/nickel transport system permease component